MDRIHTESSSPPTAAVSSLAAPHSSSTHPDLFEMFTQAVQDFWHNTQNLIPKVVLQGLGQVTWIVEKWIINEKIACVYKTAQQLKTCREVRTLFKKQEESSECTYKEILDCLKNTHQKLWETQPHLLGRPICLLKDPLPAALNDSRTLIDQIKTVGTINDGVNDTEIDSPARDISADTQKKRERLSEAATRYALVALLCHDVAEEKRESFLQLLHQPQAFETTLQKYLDHTSWSQSLWKKPLYTVLTSSALCRPLYCAIHALFHKTLWENMDAVRPKPQDKPPTVVTQEAENSGVPVSKANHLWISRFEIQVASSSSWSFLNYLNYLFMPPLELMAWGLSVAIPFLKEKSSLWIESLLTERVRMTTVLEMLGATAGLMLLQSKGSQWVQSVVAIRPSPMDVVNAALKISQIFFIYTQGASWLRAQVTSRIHTVDILEIVMILFARTLKTTLDFSTKDKEKRLHAAYNEFVEQVSEFIEEIPLLNAPQNRSLLSINEAQQIRNAFSANCLKLERSRRRFLSIVERDFDKNTARVIFKQSVPLIQEFKEFYLYQTQHLSKIHENTESQTQFCEANRNYYHRLSQLYGSKELYEVLADLKEQLSPLPASDNELEERMYLLHTIVETTEQRLSLSTRTPCPQEVWAPIEDLIERWSKLKKYTRIHDLLGALREQVGPDSRRSSFSLPQFSNITHERLQELANTLGPESIKKIKAALKQLLDKYGVRETLIQALVDVEHSVLIPFEN